MNARRDHTTLWTRSAKNL